MLFGVKAVSFDGFQIKYMRHSRVGFCRVKDSHELSVAQESKNERAKDAFGIRSDFIPGSSFEGKQQQDKPSSKVSGGSGEYVSAYWPD